MSNWKAYDEVNFNDEYILRWVREGDEYVNRITCDMMDELKSVIQKQKDEIIRLKLEWQYMYDRANMDADLAAYQQQAAEIWNDSCTSNRRKNDTT